MQQIAWIMTAIIALIAIVSSTAKIINAPFMERKWNVVLGLPKSLQLWAGLFELASGVAFLIPATMRVGAIGLSVYLFAAVVVHARIKAWHVCVYAIVMIGLIGSSVVLKSYDNGLNYE